MDPIQYGNIINVFYSETSYVVGSAKASNGNVYNIQISENNSNSFKTNNVKVFRNGILTLSYTDTQVAENKFIRTINNNKYHYNMDGELELFYVEKPTKYISTLQEHKNFDRNFIVLDIENRVVTVKDNSTIQIPYLISYYDGNISKSFFLTDFTSVDSMISACINSLLIPKINN